MADPTGTVLTKDQMDALLASLGGNTKPDIVKQGGRVYQVMPDGTGREVAGIPPVAAAVDTTPTTIHVVGKGWLQYSPAAGGWGIIQGTQESPAQPTPTIVEGGDGKKYTVTTDPRGNAVGTEIAGIPGTPVKPAQTQAQIDQAANDAHAKAERDAANSETPAAAETRRLQEITATAHAQGDAAVKEAQDKINAGISLSEADKAKLTAKLALIEADHNAAIATAKSQFDYDLAQPNTQAGLDIQQQNADTSRRQQVQTADQANRNAQIDALKNMADVGAANMDRVVKAGSATPMSMATYRMAVDPLQPALQLAHQAVASGDLPPSAIPTRPGAPRPAPALAGAPRPAPAPAAAAAPLPADVDQNLQGPI